jgi:hypothetical protein
VNHGDCDKHVDGDPESSNPRQGTKDQSQATEELSGYSEESKTAGMCKTPVKKPMVPENP